MLSMESVDDESACLKLFVAIEAINRTKLAYIAVRLALKWTVGWLGLLLASAIIIGILYRFVTNHDLLFVVAELAHFIGIATLVYKLNQCKSCAG